MRVYGVPAPGPYTFSSGVGVGLLTATSGVQVETGAGSVAFDQFRVNSLFVRVDPGATLNLINWSLVNTTGRTDVQGGTLNWRDGNIHGSIRADAGTINITAGGRSLSDGATLEVINGGRFTSNGYFFIGSSLVR